MRFFVSSKICIECCKVIPLSAAGTSLDSFLWPETSWGTEHNLLALLHPIPRLDRCNGQIVISEKLVGFTKIPLLANISSISVSIPENCKKTLVARYILAAWWQRYCLSGVMPCAFLCTTNATNNIKERTRHSFSAGVKAAVIFMPFTNDYCAFAFCLLSLIGQISVPWENVIVISFHKIFIVWFIFVTFSKVCFFVVSFLFMMAIYLFRLYL